MTKSTNEPNDIGISNLIEETESIANIFFQSDTEVRESTRNGSVDNNTRSKGGISVNPDMMSSVDNLIPNSNVCSTNLKDGASTDNVDDDCKENLSKDHVGDVTLQSDVGNSLQSKAYEDHVFHVSLENDKSTENHSDSNRKLNVKSGVESQNAEVSGDIMFCGKIDNDGTSDVSLKKDNSTGSVGDLKMDKAPDYSADIQNRGSKPEVPKRKPASGKNERVDGDEKIDVAGKGKFWNFNSIVISIVCVFYQICRCIKLEELKRRCLICTYT